MEIFKEPIFRYFEQISKIPRESGNEKAISDYLVSFAKEKKLEVLQDEAMNVIIKKPGTKGYENAPTVIIQGHMDMVCDKNKSTDHDFGKDPIKLKVDGDMIYADNTTLGGDDGIAIAYALELLASDDIYHPPIEVLMTANEEVGMDGAIAVDPKNLTGNILINIDSEEEGRILVSCAGGITTKQTLPIVWDTLKGDGRHYDISIRGLKGGHSGSEINLGRGNSNILMGRVLKRLIDEVDISIASINGGQKVNAIPREADAQVFVKKAEKEKFLKLIDELNAILKLELRASDPDVMICAKESDEKLNKVFSKETARKAIYSLLLIPNGIQTMSMEIEGLVESSSNIGIVTTLDESIIFESAVRSSVKSLKKLILDKSKAAANLLGAGFGGVADYPEWQYEPDSKIRELFEKGYKEFYGEEPEIVAIHAGLECGLFKEKMPHLDMVSFGPNIYDAHTPNEHMSISSVKRTWEYFLSVLKKIK